MEILQQIGSYAGLAAFVGLAVLSALYFSQARDVKRLREWAGRAPERAPETTGAQRVVAKPVPRAPGQAAPAQGGPAGVPGRPVPPAPAGARAAAAGATPATAVGPAAATPAARAEAARTAEEQDEDAAGASNGADENNALSQDTVIHPPPPPPGEDEEDEEDALDQDGADDTGGHAAVAEEDDEGEHEDEEDDWDDTGDRDPLDPETHWEDTGDQPPLAPRPATPAAARPIAPGAPVPGPTVPAASGSPQTSGGGSILPPYAHSRPGGRAADGGGPRKYFASRGRAIGVVAAAVLVVGGVVLGAIQLLGNSDPASSGGSATPSQADSTTPAGKKPASKGKGINPASIRVAVLNGTTVPGLAAQIGDQIERQGFRLGTVTNFNDQQRAESVVLYAPGAEREAAEVGRRLKISQREPIDAESQGVAGDATVAVVTGQDKTQ